MEKWIAGFWLWATCLSAVPVPNMPLIRLPMFSNPLIIWEGILFEERGKYYLLQAPKYEARFSLNHEDAAELIRWGQEFADTGKRYSVPRSTGGNSPGQPGFIQVYLKADGRFARYSDSIHDQPPALIPKCGGTDPIYLRVGYNFVDAVRRSVGQRADPYGAIELSVEGTVSYTVFSKSIYVLERANNGAVQVHGEFPSLLSGQPPRFAADFGGSPDRVHSLLPIVPVDSVRMGNESYVVFTAPDEVRNGGYSQSHLYRIPLAAIRHVSSEAEWKAIVAEYHSLRAAGRSLESLYVANRQGTDRNPRCSGVGSRVASMLDSPQ